MRALIKDNQWVYFDGIGAETENVFYEFFAAKHDRIRYLDTSAHWDGYYRKYDNRRSRIRRSFLPDVIKLCRDMDVPLDIIDNRPPPKYKPDVSRIKRDMLAGISLYDHQMLATYAAYKNEIGIIKAPTGSGKGELAASIVKLYNCPAVIIADIRVVIEQLFERLEIRDVSSGVDLFYGGKTPTGQPVVVGSIQSFNSPPVSLKKKKGKAEEYKAKLKRAKLFQQIVQKAELLIVDECDKSSSKQYKSLIHKHFKGRYRYGLSATPFDDAKPVQNLAVRENFGNVIYETTRAEMEEIGRIIPVRPYMIVFGEDGDPHDKMAYDIAEREIVVENPEFHEKVAQIVAGFPNDGTLIIIDTNNVESLGIALEEHIPDSKFIYGKTAKGTRNKALRAFERRELKCLIGGKILKRGLDLKGGCENLIICGGGKLMSNFDQIVGRAVRKNERGWARIFSFYFRNNHYLYDHSRKQLKALVSMGYDVKMIFKNGEMDGAQLIKSRFRIPKHIHDEKPKTR